MLTRFTEMPGKVTIWSLIIGGAAVLLALCSCCDPYHTWYTPDLNDRGYHPEPVVVSAIFQTLACSRLNRRRSHRSAAQAPRMAGVALQFASWLFQTAPLSWMLNRSRWNCIFRLTHSRLDSQQTC